MKPRLPATALLLCLCFLVSCASTTDPGKNLRRHLGGASLESYDFATEEDAAEIVTSYTHRAAKDVITLPKGDSTFTLRYTSVTNKSTNTSNVHRTDLVSDRESISFVITDLATRRVFHRQSFLIPEDDDRGPGGRPPTPPPPPSPPLCDDFFRDFNCNRLGTLQCEANRTCQTQFAHFHCCQTRGEFCVNPTPTSTCVADGPIFVAPNTRRCEFRSMMVDVTRVRRSQ